MMSWWKPVFGSGCTLTGHVSLQGDIVVFLSIILLLMIGFGVAMYTVVFPDREWDEVTVAKLFYR
jgi:hypothetical protein